MRTCVIIYACLYKHIHMHAQAVFGDCVLRPDCSDGASDGRRSGENGEEILGITLGGLPVGACG